MVFSKFWQLATNGNGKVFEAAQIDDSVRTPLNEQLDGLADLITKLSYIFAALIIVLKLMVFFGWNPIVWTLAIPTAIFFWMVIKSLTTGVGKLLFHQSLAIL